MYDDIEENELIKGGEIMCRYSEDVKKEIWDKKGQTIDGENPDEVRLDAAGALMHWDKYGDRSNPYGWEVDHIFPESKLRGNVASEMIDNIENLRPMQWQNNESKGNDYPSYRSVVMAKEGKNVEVIRELMVNADVRKCIDDLYQEYLK